MQLVSGGETGACVVVRCNSVVGVGSLDGNVFCYGLSIEKGISVFPDLEGGMEQVWDEFGAKSGGAVLSR